MGRTDMSEYRCVAISRVAAPDAGRVESAARYALVAGC
jgi:hypothetical protein